MTKYLCVCTERHNIPLQFCAKYKSIRIVEFSYKDSSYVIARPCEHETAVGVVDDIDESDITYLRLLGIVTLEIPNRAIFTDDPAYPYVPDTLLTKAYEIMRK